MTGRWGLFDDARTVEHREACEAYQRAARPAAGARERYGASLVPYVEAVEEWMAGRVSRRGLVRALFANGVPVGAIAAGMRATADEMTVLDEIEQYAPEEIDQAAHLQAMPYGAYLRTQHWKQVRAAALRAAEGRCQVCNSPDRLEVHHRTYSRRGRERPADVTVLCADCHSTHHGLRVVA